MKYNRRLFVLFIALVLLAPCAAAGEAAPAEPGTSLARINGLTWNATADEMLKALDVYESGNYTLIITGGVGMYVIDYPPVLAERVRLSCACFGEKLAMIGLYFVGETAADYAARLAGLTKVYGEPTEHDPDVLDAMFRLVMKNISDRSPRFDGWLLEDGTRVYLLLDNHMYEYYMNEAVVLDMNKTLE